MTQPTPYSRQANFTDYQASFPSVPLLGTDVDAEFNAVATTLRGALVSLAQLQRDDGALRNRLVTLDSLTPDVLLALGAGSTWTPRGTWLEATAYAVSDVVRDETGSYVCAVAHTSAAVFADDFGDGYWVLLYDSAGSIPSDGSVTPAKLADGAVTTPAIGFTGLDLAGSIRAGSGLQAGTAPLGSLLHAKAAAGDVLAKVERTTDAQGKVGLQIIGVSGTWELSQAAGSSDLDIRFGVALVGQLTSGGGLDLAGGLRATAGAFPTSGAGAGLAYVGGVGYLTAYNYTTPGWLPLKVRGQTVTLTASNLDIVAVTSTGIDVTGAVKRGGLDLGWLDLPQNVQSSAYTLALTDRGKHIYSSNVAGQTITIPTNAAAAFPIGTGIVIVNDGAAPITVGTTGITLRFAGTSGTGNRTLAVNGVASLLKVGTDRWFISGAGLT